MSNRFFQPVAAAVLAVAICFLAPAPVAAQTQPTAKVAKGGGKAWTAPRTPDGVPDLQGYFTNASATPLERPKDLGSREFYATPEEAAKAMTERVEKSSNLPTGPGTYSDVHYDDAQFGLEPNQSKVAPNLRTSLITGPEGRIPSMLPEARKRQAERAALNKGHEFDGPENRGLGERCIIMGSEVPMMPIRYNSNLQITQGKGYVAITQEMIHDTRIIPTDGGPHLPAEVRQLVGDSRGHWEGNTLVVDTTNFTNVTAFRGSGENLHVVERFTRTDPDTITYQFTVSDPSTWEKSWSAEIPMTKIEGPLFEYACHEGNYGMRNNLTGARAAEQKAQK